MGSLVFVLAVIAAIVIAVFSYRQNKKRRDALQALAARLGLRFYPGDAFGIPTAYGDCRLCSQGHSKTASNIIAGPMGPGEVRYFDYRYTTGSGKDQQTHHNSACAFHAPMTFKRLIVRPENIFDKAAGFLGFEDIDLDSAEFNKRFFVKCDDKKFAYDVLSQRAMDFFLARPGITMETGWNYLLFDYDGHLAPEGVERLIRDSAAFIELLPNYLKEERGLAGPARRAVERLSQTPEPTDKTRFDGIEPRRRSSDGQSQG